MARNLYKEYYETERSIRNYNLELEYELVIGNDEEIILALRKIIKALEEKLDILRMAIEEAR